MNGNELGRRIAQLRAEGRMQRRLALMGQGRPAVAAAGSAEECVRVAAEPARRLESLRRRVGMEPKATAR